MFSLSGAVEIFRRYLLIRTDILQKTVDGCPCEDASPRGRNVRRQLRYRLFTLRRRKLHGLTTFLLAYIRFCKVIWLINLCKFNKQTTVAITAILRLLGLILISTSSIAKIDRDYFTTFMMLVTLSVIFIVNDDSFARKEFVF